MLEQFIRDCLFGLFGFVIIIWDPYSSVWWLLRVSDSRKGEGRKEKSRKFGEQLKTHRNTSAVRKEKSRKFGEQLKTHRNMSAVTQLIRAPICYIRALLLNLYGRCDYSAHTTNF